MQTEASNSCRRRSWASQTWKKGIPKGLGFRLTGRRSGRLTILTPIFFRQKHEPPASGRWRSGKTAVAFYCAMPHGKAAGSALSWRPRRYLLRQHFLALRHFSGDTVRVYPRRNACRHRKGGRKNCIGKSWGDSGTHAVLSEKTEYRDLRGSGYGRAASLRGGAQGAA